MLPCVIFEDEHLLVVNKPAGLNTHAPSPYAGEGLYDWLRHREARWAKLAIIHRLDKETSGVIVFSKTPLGNRSLTEQFTRRTVRKKYLLLTGREVREKELVVRSSLVRAGERYVSRPLRRAGGELAETQFRLLAAGGVERLVAQGEIKLEPPYVGSCTAIEAEPLTGRTHQIRVHAADKGFPILGDTLYGGPPAPRVYLHAAELTLKHPESGEQKTFRAAADFAADPRLLLRTALIEPESSNAYRLIHGASDGWPGWYVERPGDYLLSQSEQPLNDRQAGELHRLAAMLSARGAYHKLLTRQVRQTSPTQASPQLVLGEPAPERFPVRENGLQFELSFEEGYSVGLFLDQRDNRRRLLTGHVAADFDLWQGTTGAPPLHPTLGDHQLRHELSSLGLARARPTFLPLPEGEGRGEGNAFFPSKAQRLSQVTPSPLQWGDPRRTLEILNTFAYTCAFSVCAAKAGAHTTSLDLSQKYLEWGKRNFILNQIEPGAHDFIYGDTFDWLRRLAKKGRSFDIILLDPPTFSQSRESGIFRVERDYGKLVTAALPLLRAGGVLFASTNAAEWAPEKFLGCVEKAIHNAKRKAVQRHYFPQPPDFPVSRAEPAYLKTVWLKIH